MSTVDELAQDISEIDSLHDKSAGDIAEALIAKGWLKGPWESMDTAPKDGTWIQAGIPGNGADNVIAFVNGFVDKLEQAANGWMFMTEQEPPDCWTDGVCWESNINCEKSVEPTRWKPLAS